MSRPVIILLGVILAVGLFALPGSADRTPAGSFLKWSAASGSDLSTQVNQVPEVGNRYARFYGTTPGQVADRFEGLRYTTLSKPLKTRVHFVGRNGRIVSETRTLPKGSPVFVSSSGTPVLDGRCGNPLSTKLPVRVAQALPSQPVAKTTEVAVTDIPAQGAESPEPFQVVEAPLPEPVMTEVLAQPTEILTPETILPTAEAPAAPATTSIASAAGAGSGFLGALGLVPLLLIAGNGGDGGDNNGPIIPEPGAFVTLASAVAGFGILLKRKS